MRAVGGVLLSLVLVGCPLPYGKGSLKVVVSPRAAQTLPDTGVLAAFREVDITPEPGPPLYGFSTDGEKVSTGYWLRLKARVLALEVHGQRLVMVQADLGGASSLMHRRIAAKLVDQGIDPSRLVMSATHTHGGPGGYFGDRFCNHLIPARNGYDEALTTFFVDSIVAGAQDAFANLKPARLAVAQEQVDTRATSNRSIEAWRHNFDEGAYKPLESDGKTEKAIDHTLTVLRVDTESSPGAGFKPAGMWTTFAVHGNSFGYRTSLLHGDIHGLTARLTKAKLRGRVSEDFVAASTTGAEGDVAAGEEPGKNPGPDLTYNVSTLVSEAAVRAFEAAQARIDAGGIAITGIPLAYEEVSLRGAPTSESNLCPATYLANPQVAGSEEGRAPPIAAWVGAREGNTRAPAGCMSQRGRFIVSPKFVMDPDEAPDVLPFQVVRIGSGADGVVFASVPGEATTEEGHAIQRAIHSALNPRGIKDDVPITLLGLTNGYVAYITTGPEYLAQAYEGGNTMYGGQEGRLFAEEFNWLAGGLNLNQTMYQPRREFWPGTEVPFIPAGDAALCKPETWSAVKVVQQYGLVSFVWKGAKPGERCRPPAHVRMECEDSGAWRVPLDVDGLPQSDEGRALEVNQSGEKWTVLWRPPPASHFGKCRFAVARPAGDLFSDEFTAPGAP